MPTVRSLDAKPLYAIAGFGDAAVTTLRSQLANRATRMQTQVRTVQSTVQHQVKTVQTQVQSQVQSLPTLRQTLPTHAKEWREQMRKQATGLVANAEKLYDDFAAQGEKAVAKRRGAVQPGRKPAATKPAAKGAAKPSSKATASANGPARDVPAQSPARGTTKASSSAT